MNTGKNERASSERMAAIKTLAPFAELFWAGQLLNLHGSGYGGVEGEGVLGLAVDFTEGAAAIEIWAGKPGEPNATHRKGTVGTHLAKWRRVMAQNERGPRYDPSALAGYPEIARAALDAADRMGPSGWRRAMSAVGANYAPMSSEWSHAGPKTLGAAQAWAWLAEGSIDLGRSVKFLMAPQGLLEPGARAWMESAALSEVARKVAAPEPGAGFRL